MYWPHARTVDGLIFGAYNIRRVAVDPDTGKAKYQAVLTSIWSQQDEAWQDVEGTSFIYRSGSTKPPFPVIVAEVTNYLEEVRIIGLCLFGVSLLISLAGVASVWLLRNDDIVRRSQPTFLALLCLGSVLMSASIFTLSWDEGAGWTDDQLDAACQATPWFFFVGQVLLFTAMFTKLWRIQRVMQFSRRVVTVRHVSGPLLLLLLLVCLVLLTLWAVLDPWTWERRVLPGVTPSESYGECTSDNFWAYFGPLMGVLVFSEAAAVFFAFKTMDIQQDLSDYKGVLLAIAFHLQAWIVGVPGLVFLNCELTVRVVNHKI